MRNSNREPWLARFAWRTRALQPSTRLTALLFIVSVALPILWSAKAGSVHAQGREAVWPAAPETTEELIALAAVAPARGNLSRIAAERQALSRPVAVRERAETAAPDLLSINAAPTASEYYARSRQTLRRSSVDVKPLAAVVSTISDDKAQVKVEETLLAQAAPAPARVPALLQRSAAAPQLSAVGSATSRSARAAAAEPATTGVSSKEAPRGTAATAVRRTGPLPATRKEIEDARQARAAALAGGGSTSAPRRSAGMHRVAAAAASSLNEATPFRTAGSGSSRFSGAQAGDTLGEGLDRAAEAVSVVPGLRLENVSLTAGYSSNGLPGARSIYGADSGLGSDSDFSAQTTLAYRKRFRTSSFGLTYTPSRQQRSRYSQWNTTDHVFGIEIDQRVGRRWGLAFNAGAANTGLEQFWFRQPVFRRVANPPTTFEELVQRVEAGEFTDDEFASILTGAPIVDDPGGRELELSRVVSLNSNVSASYAQSARSTITFGGGISKFDSSFRTDVRDRSDRFALNGFSTRTAFVQNAYKFNAGMTAGVRYNISNIRSSFGDSANQSALVYIRKRLNRFWDVGAEGGAGYVDVNQVTGFLASQPGVLGARSTWAAGGSVNYRYSGHQFGASVRRSVGDGLGLSAASTSSAAVNWEWTSPRMPWVFNAGGSFSRSDWGGIVLADTSTAFESSLLQGGATRRLTPTTALSTGYYYGRFSSPLRGLLTGATVHRVQASFLWRPAEQR